MPGEIARIVPGHEPGIYYVGRDTWQVGSRYDLQKVLGTGSFSAVCLAYDNLEGDKVALKRVGDVFASPDNAKRVLREVCIMRRLEHPNIIRLRDVFLKPSATGKYVFRGGRLVPTSYDCYMALECCDQGDLFNMRGQLPEHEVRSLMWQLLSALRYLHGLNVWHRDIKTGNLLLTLHEGRRVLKVADFGSARSAKDASGGSGGSGGQGVAERNDGEGRALPLESFDGMEPEDREEGQQRVEQDTGPNAGSAFAPAGSRSCGDGNRSEAVLPWCGSAARRPPRSDGAADLAAGGGCASSRHGDGGLVAVPAADGGFQAPLTSLVCTPCYRAPEVIMSRGGYSSAIDMWSAGCVFGELLQRAAYVGKASTPHLQVAPVFALTGKPLTPHAGQRYGVADQQQGLGARGAAGAGAYTFAELSALFAVIGTPAWACIEAVRSDAWRRYLFHIPGRAPTLHRRFGQAGEVAVDLLARLLQFDPIRRASAEEAMAHEYFALMHMEAQLAATGLAAEALSSGRQRSQLRRKSASPEAEEKAPARPSGGSAAVSPAGLSPARLPTWPPGRGPLRRGSDSGGPGPPSEMEVEGDDKSGSRDECDSGSGTVPAALEKLTPSNRAGCSSLLTKRKQLESTDDDMSVRQEHQHSQPLGWCPPEELAGVAKEATGQGQGEGQRPAAAGDEGGRAADKGALLSFWQIDEPALALAALEAELVLLVPPDVPAAALVEAALPHTDRARAATASQTPEALALLEVCKERLREMLERECTEHAARAAAQRGAEGGARGRGSSGGGSAAVGSGSGGPGGSGGVRRNASDGLMVGLDGQILGGAAGASALHGHLRPDPGQQLDPSVIGYERIPYHADAAAARLEPEKHLWAGRHGEWTQSSLATQRREASSGTWGVTLMPPGLDAGTAAGRAYIDVMRTQQAR